MSALLSTHCRVGGWSAQNFWLRALGALVAVCLLSGCTTPVGIRIANPREVQSRLTRSALTDARASDFSQNQLRRYDLLEVFDHEPDVALAKLHAAALAAGLPPDALFALASSRFYAPSRPSDKRATRRP